jgi:hypothetical protein
MCTGRTKLLVPKRCTNLLDKTRYRTCGSDLPGCGPPPRNAFESLVHQSDWTLVPAQLLTGQWPVCKEWSGACCVSLQHCSWCCWEHAFGLSNILVGQNTSSGGTWIQVPLLLGNWRPCRASWQSCSIVPCCAAAPMHTHACNSGYWLLLSEALDKRH